MTQEDKELLLKDLCARLIHGVICDRLGQPKKLLSISPYKVYCLEFDNGEYTPSEYKIEDIKPYLRPISSMTEEECDKLREILEIESWDIPGEYIKINDAGILRLFTELGKDFWTIAEATDYLNSIHVDYRGLISMGLALEAPENLYD